MANTRRIGKVAALAVGTITLAAALSGCVSEYHGPLGNCYPSYNAGSAYGNFSAQQSGPGGGIQWGAYPNSSVKATRYLVDVYVGTKRVDHKDQNYAPHGSVSYKDVAGRAGQIFALTGAVYNGSSNTLLFTLQCKIS